MFLVVTNAVVLWFDVLSSQLLKRRHMTAVTRLTLCPLCRCRNHPFRPGECRDLSCPFTVMSAPARSDVLDSLRSLAETIPTLPSEMFDFPAALATLRWVANHDNWAGVERASASDAFACARHALPTAAKDFRLALTAYQVAVPDPDRESEEGSASPPPLPSITDEARHFFTVAKTLFLSHPNHPQFEPVSLPDDRFGLDDDAIKAEFEHIPLSPNSNMLPKSSYMKLSEIASQLKNADRLLQTSLLGINTLLTNVRKMRVQLDQQKRMVAAVMARHFLKEPPAVYVEEALRWSDELARTAPDVSEERLALHRKYMTNFLHLHKIEEHYVAKMRADAVRHKPAADAEASDEEMVVDT